MTQQCFCGFLYHWNDLPPAEVSRSRSGGLGFVAGHAAGSNRAALPPLFRLVSRGLSCLDPLSNASRAQPSRNRTSQCVYFYKSVPGKKLQLFQVLPNFFENLYLSKRVAPLSSWDNREEPGLGLQLNMQKWLSGSPPPYFKGKVRCWLRLWLTPTPPWDRCLLRAGSGSVHSI